MKTVKLYNGVEIPEIGYGTWLIDNKDAPRCVQLALEAGYRHIDSAQAYGNEIGVGEAIKNSGLPREEIFITTKVMAEYKSAKKARKSIEDSLLKLGVDYIDLYIYHM